MQPKDFPVLSLFLHQFEACVVLSKYNCLQMKHLLLFLCVLLSGSVLSLRTLNAYRRVISVALIPFPLLCGVFRIEGVQSLAALFVENTDVLQDTQLHDVPLDALFCQEQLSIIGLLLLQQGRLRTRFRDRRGLRGNGFDTRRRETMRDGAQRPFARIAPIRDRWHGRRRDAARPSFFRSVQLACPGWWRCTDPTGVAMALFNTLFEGNRRHR
mmetsp:Transcript_86806/g.144381  ORF Transcript_86806/g.144381 Transcript_86806/m.144381 type:complete len:213 (-) Transcript_86806:943-1581(-)